MGLKEYLESHCMIKARFAKKLGITSATLHRMIAGKTYPSAKTAQRIVELTNGEVTFEDLFKKKELKELKE